MPIEKRDVLANDVIDMAEAEAQEMIQAFALD